MITDRIIINFLMWMGGLILGSYLAVTSSEQNYEPLLLTVGAVFMIFTFVILRDRLAAFPLMGAFVAGNFNFLPFGLSAADICTIILVLYFAVTYIALKQRPMQVGPIYFFLPILVIFSIILYHDHSFGLRVLGSTMEGSRPGVLMLLTSVAYLCGINIPTASTSFLRSVPWWCLLITVLAAIPFILSTYVPSLTPYLFVMTTNVNANAYVGSTSYTVETSEGLEHNLSQASIGIVLIMCLVSYYPIHTWWRPHRWFVAFLGLGCLALVLTGGYRNSLATFGLIVLLGMWCYSSWRSLFVLPIMVFVLFGLSLGKEYQLFDLPLQIQRSMSFLPGKWDDSVMASTESSDEFRTNIIRIYLQEDLYKDPWFGNGLSFDAAKFDELNYLSEKQETADHYYQAEAFITGKLFHTGWLSLYDIVGLVGGAAFVFFSLSLIWASGRMVFRQGADRLSPLYPLRIWMFIRCSSDMLSFFLLYGDIRTAFPGLCYSAIIVFHLKKLDQASRLETDLLLPQSTVHQPGPRSSMIQMKRGMQGE